MAGRHTSHTMEHKLLKAVATGDADLLAQALGIWPTATAEQGDVDQSCCLKGVTAEGSSVLHIAASRGHLKLVVMICTHDISLIKLRNNQLDTPLICAARAGHVDVVDYLVRAASAMQEPERSVLRAWNSGGATAMHEAVRNGYAPVLQKLMSSDSGLATMVDDKGMSPLYLAVVSNRPDMVGILIGKSSDGVRSPASYAGPDGKTALHAAVNIGKAGKASVTRMLMEMCLNCDELLDNKQRNVLHCAVEYGRLMVVWYICRNPKFTRLLNAGDCEGNTPLHLAVKHGNAIIISCLMMNTRVNLSIINHGGSTPLDVAFNKSTRDYSLSWLSSTSITMCLQACNAYTSRFLNRADKRFLEDKEESSVYTNVSQSILCISVLIAAGSFAAAFTPPGGYIADGEDAGMPLLKEYAEFSSYVAANSMSFYCSTFATCLLVHDSLTNRRRRRYLSLSAGLVFLAVVGMVLTFLVVTTDLTLDSGNSWDDLIFSITVGVFVFLLMFGRVIFVLSILAIPICWRLPMQLWRGNHLHFWQDILKVIAAAIFLVYVSLGFLMTVFSVLEVVLAFFFVEIENVTPSSIEFCSWRGCVIQHGDLIALYPS
uniref:PGG domain-containing protein n=1 Tax=Oryza barthii TaxID=65489 RepID=A0A0D3GEP4_9ORYZ